MAHTPTTDRPKSTAREGLRPVWQRMRDAARTTPSPDVDVRAAATDAPLTDRERQVLDCEARGWPRGGEKLAAIRDAFGWSETRYYQVLRALLDRRAALEQYPAMVWRLRDQLARRR